VIPVALAAGIIFISTPNFLEPEREIIDVDEKKRWSKKRGCLKINETASVVLSVLSILHIHSITFLTFSTFIPSH
jgi:hypothetical protein